MKRRICIRCNLTVLQADFPGIICLQCQEDFRRDRFNWISGMTISLEQVAVELDIDPDTLKRAYRAGKLPPRIEGVKKILWATQVIKDWFTAGCPDMKRLQHDVTVYRSLQGEVGLDDLTGEKTAGTPVDLQVQVFHKSSGQVQREGKVIKTRLPTHGPVDRSVAPWSSQDKETTER